ncbi:MAG: hypothetical protein ABIS50_15035 [Luteolibacter sp.]|uniref:hypothetical protein n=1 Tax=Luteolibacter sp. TaxID=1962973 RepID=UPI0032645432
MVFEAIGRKRGSWEFAVFGIILSYVASILGPLTLLIVPLLVTCLFITLRRRAWLCSLILLLANPLSLFFIGGVVDYAKGAPALHSMGLPSREFYNVDPTTRCFRQTGGCVVYGGEWIHQVPHNIALIFLSGVFGPPSRSYDGPYPSKEEALRVVSSAPKLNPSDFIGGRVHVGSATLEIKPDDLVELLEDQGIFRSTQETYSLDDLSGTDVYAAIFENRCLILRFKSANSMFTSEESPVQQNMVLFDSKNMRPFAYFPVQGERLRRNPKLRYLAEQSR